MKLPPAIILGNSPRLPVAELPLLDGLLTIGVNRILVRYQPTVHVWVDQQVWVEMRHEISEHPCSISTRQSAKHRMRLRTGVEVLSDGDHSPDTLTVYSNVGATAARWALSIGCPWVYCLGMSTTAADMARHFYGGRRNPVSSWGPMACEAQALERDKRVLFVDEISSIPIYDPELQADQVLVREHVLSLVPVDDGWHGTGAERLNRISS